MIIRAKIGSAVARVSSWNPATADMRTSFMYIDLGAVDQRRKRISDASIISVVEAPSRARQLVKSGDVLVSTVRPNLNGVARVTDAFDGATASTGFCVLRPTSDLDSSYLFHWVRSPSFIDEMSRKATGQSYPAVSDKIIKNSEMPMPTIDEQRRVANLLDQVDDLRTKRNQAGELLDDLAESIFTEMFNVSTGIPIVPLGDYLRFVTSGGRGWARYYSDNGARFIRSLDVRMNEIASQDAVYVTPPDNAEAKRTRVQAGDVLLTITGSLIGRVSPASQAHHGNYVSQHVAILRPDRNRLIPEYLSFYLSLADGGQRQISRMQYGQTKPGLNFQQIRSFQVPVPPLDSQKCFVERLNSLKTVRSGEHAHLAELDSLFASLQDRAFRGEI